MLARRRSRWENFLSLAEAQAGKKEAD